VGSYADEKGGGEEVCDMVLQKLQACPMRLDLCLFCCGSLNTAPCGRPLATSLAYDSSNGDFRQGSGRCWPCNSLLGVGGGGGAKYAT